MQRECTDIQDYWRREIPTSPGRVLLIRALGRLCAQLHGHDLALVALTFDEEGSIFVDDPARSQILGAARMLGEAFAAGDVRTYVREFGGSVPVTLPPSAWELDEFVARFATSALDPSKPFDALATTTHWIFVDEGGLDRLLKAEREAPSDLEHGSGDSAGDGAAGGHGPSASGPHRFVRMPELETRTGLSRATIYRRIAVGRFPKPVQMDGNISAWREDAVSEWLANPR